MDSFAAEGLNPSILIAYGILITIYLIILRLLLNFIQQLGRNHRYQRSIIDSDIHRARTSHVDSSMQTFDPFNAAIVIAKAGTTVLGVAILLVLSTVKVGFPATLTLLIIVIIVLWAINHILRQFDKTEVMKNIHKITRHGGNTSSILLLSIALVVVVFMLIVLQ